MKLYLKPSVAVERTVAFDTERVRFLFDSGRKELVVDLDKDGSLLLDQLMNDGVPADDIRLQPLQERGMLVDDLPPHLRAGRGGGDDLLARQHLFLLDRVTSRVAFEAANQRLADARVTIIGLGGIGSNLALALARCGIGVIDLVDFDTVEVSNLNRQQAFRREDVGKLKADALREHIQGLGLGVDVNAHFSRAEAVDRALIDGRIVVNCADQPSILQTSESILRGGKPGLLAVGGGYYCDLSYAGPLFAAPTLEMVQRALAPEIRTSMHLPGIGGNTVFTAALPVALISQQLFNHITETGEVELCRVWIMDWRTFQLRAIEVSCQ